MNSERAILNQQQIDFARNRTDFAHPVLDVLEQNAFDIEIIHQITQETHDITDPQIKDNWIHLANQFVEAGSFSLSPEDLISLWSKPEIQQLHLYAKYGLSRIIGASYAIQGVENPSGKDYPAILTGKDFEDIMSFLRRQEDIQNVGPYIIERVNEIHNMTSILSSSAFDWEKFKSKNNKNQLLFDISENFGNGLVPVRFAIEAILNE